MIIIIFMLITTCCVYSLFSQPDEPVVFTTPSTIASDSTAVDNHDMEARSEYLPTQKPTVSSANNNTV